MSQPDKSTSKIAVYAGSFDPITNGHVDLVERALDLFDQIIVLVAHSSKKSPVFSATERQTMALQCFVDEPRVSVDVHEDLLVDYAKNKGASFILRGLRGVSDFDFEFQMATMNRRMHPDIETFFLMSSEQFFFVNSTLVKEVASHGGDVRKLVPPHVEVALKEKLCLN